MTPSIRIHFVLRCNDETYSWRFHLGHFRFMDHGWFLAVDWWVWFIKEGGVGKSHDLDLRHAPADPPGLAGQVPDLWNESHGGAFGRAEQSRPRIHVE
jgi:hypothetical protein